MRHLSIQQIISTHLAEIYLFQNVGHSIWQENLSSIPFSLKYTNFSWLVVSHSIIDIHLFDFMEKCSAMFEWNCEILLIRELSNVITSKRPTDHVLSGHWKVVAYKSSGIDKKPSSANALIFAILMQKHSFEWESVRPQARPLHLKWRAHCTIHIHFVATMHELCATVSHSNIIVWRTVYRLRWLCSGCNVHRIKQNTQITPIT